MTPSEGPAENLRNALQVIALARYGKTVLGEPGRILTDEEHKAVIVRLMRAVRQIEAAALVGHT